VTFITNDYPTIVVVHVVVHCKGGTSLTGVIRDTLKTSFSPLASYISSGRVTMRIFITSIEALFYSIPITYLKLRLNHSSSKVMARTNVCVGSIMIVSWQ
jgi:hypothetical protein